MNKGNPQTPFQETAGDSCFIISPELTITPRTSAWSSIGRWELSSLRGRGYSSSTSSFRIIALHSSGLALADRVPSMSGRRGIYSLSAWCIELNRSLRSPPVQHWTPWPRRPFPYWPFALLTARCSTRIAKRRLKTRRYARGTGRPSGIMRAVRMGRTQHPQSRRLAPLIFKRGKR
jgi:hypothetical protein